MHSKSLKLFKSDITFVWVAFKSLDNCFPKLFAVCRLKITLLNSSVKFKSYLVSNLLRSTNNWLDIWSIVFDFIQLIASITNCFFLAASKLFSKSCSAITAYSNFSIFL